MVFWVSGSQGKDRKMSLSPTQCSLKRQKSFMSKCKWLVHVYFWRSISGILKRPLVLKRLDITWKIVSKWPCCSSMLWHFQTAHFLEQSLFCALQWSCWNQATLGFNRRRIIFTRASWTGSLKWNCWVRNSIILQLPKPKNIFTHSSQIASCCEDEHMHLFCLDIQSSPDTQF